MIEHLEDKGTVTAVEQIHSSMEERNKKMLDIMKRLLS